MADEANVVKQPGAGNDIPPAQTGSPEPTPGDKGKQDAPKDGLSSQPSDKGGKKPSEQSIPIDRLNEVIGQRNDERAKREALEERYHTLEAEINILKEGKREIIPQPEEDFWADPETIVRKRVDEGTKDLRERLELREAADIEKGLEGEWNNSPELQRLYPTFKELTNELTTIAAKAGFKGKYLTAPVINGAYNILLREKQKQILEVARTIGVEEERKSKEIITDSFPAKSSGGKEKSTKVILSDEQKKVLSAMGISEDTAIKRLEGTIVDDKGKIITEFKD